MPSRRKGTPDGSTRKGTHRRRAPHASARVRSTRQTALYLYHQTEACHLRDIMRHGKLLPALKTGNQEQNPSTDRSPYVFFNVFAQEDLAGLSYRSGVGLVFDISNALLGQPLYTSSHHSTGNVARKGVCRHVFAARARMLRVFRDLRRSSIRTSLGVVAEDDAYDPTFDKVKTAAAFQEVFTTYEMPLTALQCVFLSESNEALRAVIRRRFPHVRVVVHRATEEERVHDARHTLQALRIEGVRCNGSRAAAALATLEHSQSVAARAVCKQLRAALARASGA
jgi:hypothetical protein